MLRCSRRDGATLTVAPAACAPSAAAAAKAAELPARRGLPTKIKTFFEPSMGRA
jgi:hypothetical protein